MTAPFLGQIEIFGFNFAPRGWAQCNGQTLPINQYQALFALLGTAFGGNGIQTFGLPDLRSRTPIGQGNYIGGGSYIMGQRGGEESHMLLQQEMPQHNHLINCDATAGTTETPSASTVLGKSNGAQNPPQGGTFTLNVYSTQNPNNTMAPASVGFSGGSAPHPNIMPYLALNLCIALTGIFPSRN
jgi:microcystin-dependent protein